MIIITFNVSYRRPGEIFPNCLFNRKFTFFYLIIIFRLKKMSKPYKKYERLPTQFDDENAATAFEMLVNDWKSSLDSTTTGIGFQRSLEEQGECFIEFGNCVKPIHSNCPSSLNPTLFTFD